MTREAVLYLNLLKRGDVWWCAMSQSVNLGEATGFLMFFVLSGPGRSLQVCLWVARLVSLLVFRVTFCGQILRPQKHRFLTIFSICVRSNHLIISDYWGTKFWPIPNGPILYIDSNDWWILMDGREIVHPRYFCKHLLALEGSPPV